jgi:hypothetical protein
VIEAAASRGIDALVVAGEIEEGTECPVRATSLVARFGRDRAWSDPTGCIADAVAEALSGGPTGRVGTKPP